MPSGGEPTSGDQGKLKYDHPIHDANVDDGVEPLVYVQTNTTLYRLDTEALDVEPVGDFIGCGPVQDIALDENDQLYAAGFDDLFIVDVDTMQCTAVSDMSQDFTSNLSLVPAGTVHPTKEMLVGYHVIYYQSHDMQTGEMTTHTSLANPVRGDVVSVLDGPTLVSTAPNFEVDPDDAPDHLRRINPTTGAELADLGPFGPGQNVEGLAFWGGTVYGFTDAGEILAIELNEDDTFEVTLTTSTGLEFRGAASSTVAPLVPAG
jgi:hypothetical protein